MYRRAAVILAFIAIVFSLSAEEYPAYSLGARGGATMSWVLFNPSVPVARMPLTWHAGAQFRVVHKKYFGMKAELNYVQKGFADDKESWGARRVDYVELPLLSHFTFGEKLFRFYIDFGPYISVAVNDVEPGMSDEPQHTMPVNSPFDYGLAAGFGFEFNTRRAGIYALEARYTFGFDSFFRTSSADYFSLAMNQNINVSLVYLIPLNRHTK